MIYWSRLLEKTISEVIKTFPVTVITGPRQSGKSTLLEYIFNKKAAFINLDDPNFRKLLSENPIDYLTKQNKPVVIDEIQYMPELASYIKILVDKDRTPGQWFITGSQQFAMMRHVSESLAGRAAILYLPTFQVKEIKRKVKMEDYLLNSTYPEPAVNKKVNNAIWYSSYLQTYLERDVRAIMNIDNLRDFEQLMRFLAAHTSQELNYSKASNALGISVPTVKRWVSILEASYIIFLIPPFFNNYKKRIIKSPKLYFYDIGLINYFIGIKDSNLLLNGPMAGPIFETAIVSEILKAKYAQGVKPEIYYWRSQSGIEIDLIIPEKGKYIPYEIKLSSNLKPQFYKNILYWLNLSKQSETTGYIISNCKKDSPLPSNIKNIYWKDL